MAFSQCHVKKGKLVKRKDAGILNTKGNQLILSTIPRSGRRIVITILLMILMIGSVSYGNALSREDVESISACHSERDQVDALDRAANHNPLAPPRINNKPVDVDVGLYVEQLDSISEADFSFKIEAFVELVWCDPRLAYDADAFGESHMIFLEDVARNKLNGIWWPDLEFVNAADPPQIQQEELIIFPDGTVVYEERLAVPIRARYDFSKFPFDRQLLEIEVESFAWSSSDLVLHREEHKIGFAENFNIPSWHLTGYQSEVRNVKEIRDRDEFSELVLTIEAERVALPYIYRLIIPLCMIVIISWSVFWLRSTSTGRFGVTFTTILTVVAFNFIVTRKLPNVPEITYIETLIGFSFGFLLLVVIENTIVERLTAQSRPESAHRIDRIARTAFPIIYFTGMALVTMVVL